MRSRALLGLVMLLLPTRDFASCARGATQDEGQDLYAAFRPPTSIDYGVLQEALRVKCMLEGSGIPEFQNRWSLEHLVGIKRVDVFVSPDLTKCGVTEHLVKIRAELGFA